MAPSYKLIYFDGRGVSESIRYLFKYGNIDFEDVRIKKEDWPKIKETTPFGQLPILEHNGKRISQSIAICRYVGKLVKLGGGNDWENLEIDAVVDTINDLRRKISAFYKEPDETKKKALKDTVINETLPFYLSRLDAIVQNNNGYLVAGKLTWADFRFVSMIANCDNIVGSEALKKYLNIMALREKIEALPAIKKWIETRPKTVI